MMNDLLSQTADAEPEIDIEPDVDADEPDVDLDGAAEAEPTGDALDAAPLPLVQVLPADFPLPALIRFVPDARLRVQADEAARYALSLTVSGPEGLQAADDALTVLRGSQKAIEECFREPVALANDLHKSLTGTRADWLAGVKAATETVGRRIYQEQRRLEQIAAEERRKAQAEADRQAREDAKRRAAEAEKAKAPAAIVENLQKQAETAQAAPVHTPTIAPALKGTTVTKNWQPTVAGTPRDAGEQQPAMADLTDVQRATVLEAMKAVIAGGAPMACFEINWSYLRKRAKADEATFAIPGFEAYDAGGIRAKATRSK